MNKNEYQTNNTIYSGDTLNESLPYFLFGGIILLFFLKFKSVCKKNNKIPNLKSLLIESDSIPEEKIIEECSICLVKLNNGEKLIKLKCNHYYHEECIVKCFNSGYKLCPYCRNNIDII